MTNPQDTQEAELREKLANILIEADSSSNGEWSSWEVQCYTSALKPKLMQLIHQSQVEARIDENHRWEKTLYNRDLSRPIYVTFADLSYRITELSALKQESEKEV